MADFQSSTTGLVLTILGSAASGTNAAMTWGLYASTQFGGSHSELNVDSEMLFQGSKVADLDPAGGRPMPLVLCCLLMVSCQFFLTYALMVLSRIFLKGQIEKALEKVAQGVKVLPMVGLLFLVTEMRAESVALQGGRPERYGLPRWWVGWIMMCGTVAGILAMICHFFCELPQVAASWIRRLYLLLSFVQFGMLLALVMDVVCMKTPYDVWLLNYASVGMTDVMAEIVSFLLQFFLVHLSLVALGGFSRRLGQATQAAVLAQSIGPVLCILYMLLGERALGLAWDASTHEEAMHNLELFGKPLLLAQACFHIGSVGLLIQTLIAALAGGLAPLPGADVEGESGKLDYRRPFGVLRRVAALTVYVVAFVVIVHLFWDFKSGFPQLQIVVLVLALMYYGVSFTCFIAGAWDEALEDPEEHAHVEDARPGRLCCPPGLQRLLSGAKDAVAFCPMLCVLFLGTQLRAITVADAPFRNWHAQPQWWVQVWMSICMSASVLQLVIAVCTCGNNRTPLLPEPRYGEETEHSEDSPVASYGSVQAPEGRQITSANVLVALKGVCASTIYVCVVVVIFETYRMSPEDLHYSRVPW